MSDHVLPPRGGWVIVTRRLPGNLPQVPIFSIFYAEPYKLHPRGSFLSMAVPGSGMKEAELGVIYRHRHTRQRALPGEVLPDRADEIALEHQVRILAPDGEVVLNPYEWVPCGDVTPFLTSIGKGVTLHEYGKARPARSYRDQMFYMRQRGIDRATCITLLFDRITKPNVLWLEIAPEIAGVFDRGYDPPPYLKGLRVKINGQELHT